MQVDIRACEFLSAVELSGGWGKRGGNEFEEEVERSDMGMGRIIMHFLNASLLVTHDDKVYRCQ